MSLTVTQKKVIADIRAAFPEEPLTLIGAAALVYHFGEALTRRTNDLDVTLLCDSVDTKSLAAKLPAFTQDAKIVHRFHHNATGLRTDILAVGTNVLKEGKLNLSPDDTVMDLTGFDLALDTSVSSASEAGVHIAPPAVVVLLKMAAFLDRPGARERDLEDIAFVLQNCDP